MAAILRQEGPCPSRTCQHIDVGDDRRTATYDAVSERLGADGDPPPGLIVHTVGFAGNVFRIFDVWETDADRVRFDEERLGPILAEVMGDDGPRGQSQSCTYELHDVIAP